MQHKTSINPPVAKKIPKQFSLHGDTRIDNYYWMKDRENPEVIAYLNAENDYKEQELSHLKIFREDLFKEIKSRIKEDDQSVPYFKNGYHYITRYETGTEYPIYSRKKGTLEAEEEIMLNINVLAESFSFYNVVGLNVSPDNKILVYGEDTTGRRIYNIRFKNLETGEMYEDQIPNTTGGAYWANDNLTVFYGVKNEALRAYKIYKHKLGTPASEDEAVYEEKDDTFNTYVFKSKSERYLFIASVQSTTTEYQFLDADQPDGDWHMIQPRERGHEYFIAHYEDKFYIRTNLNAQNFRLMVTPENKPGKVNWRELIPNREDVLLEDLDIFKNHLVLSERIKGITQLRIMPWEGKEHYINFGEEAFMAYTGANPEFDTEILRVGYQSMTTPATVYDYNMRTRELVLRKQQEVLGDFNPDHYESERLYVEARDGVKVPVSIVYRKGFRKDGSQPLLLYAYGSYGHSMDPYFSSVRLSLLDRGFAYAIAHIRGGEELGRHWYESGKLLNKKNTFYDFIDCAQFLIANRYTSQDRLFAMGGSAGGLLMGAIVNMRPNLWKGVVAAVPFVDVITTMLDDSIPLTTGEYDEWGNPLHEEYYHYIKSYSPYDQVEAKDYPAMLITTGLHDSQVQYWEPAKWVAKLREMKTDYNPLLLHTNMDAGHGGASGRFEKLKEVAMEYAFILDLAGKVS